MENHFSKFHWLKKLIFFFMQLNWACVRCCMKKKLNSCIVCVVTEFVPHWTIVRTPCSPLCVWTKITRRIASKILCIKGKSEIVSGNIHKHSYLRNITSYIIWMNILKNQFNWHLFLSFSFLNKLQKADGIPIHLKRGARDKVLYYLTVGLTVVGLGFCADFVYHLP